jgi:beta-lactamase regulating signal transducer with metallopeptidase domain
VVNNRRIADKNLCQMVNNCAKEMGIKRQVDLYINEYITTPMLTGIINPVILLPDNNINLEYAKYILSHELTHYKNKDVIVKRIAILIKTIQWFNPLIYLLIREMDKWCEYTCDEMNSYNLTNEMKKTYGMAILEAAVDIPVYSSNFGASLFLPKQNLKKRLMFMFNKNKMRKKVVCISGIILIIFINAAVLFSFSAECFYRDNQQMINGILEQDRGLQNNVSNAVSTKIQINKFKYKAMD